MGMFDAKERAEALVLAAESPGAARETRDVPELPFPDGTDLFQLLWCPNDHDEPWYGPKPVTVWRKAADVTAVLAGPPEPVFDSDREEADYDPVPCLCTPSG